MNLTMTPVEREAFLSDVRIGVLGVERPDQPPSLTPVWYRYVDGVVEVVTSHDTAKVALLRETGRASFCVQREEAPPAFVTVEGSVTVTPAPEGRVAAVASRYLGEEAGAAFADGPGQRDDTLISLRVERWRTADFGKQGY